MKVSRALYGASLLLGGVLLVCGANAMTFQDTVNVQFSFDTSLGITLSSRNIVISELSPGSAAYSNTITATVSTNNVYGYTLSAMVGGTGQTAANNTLYSSVTGTSFASLASDADITLANFQDNNWGYTTAGSIDNSTTYSGLIYNTGKTINKTTDYMGNPADGYVGTESTSFTIGAKAAPTQASGDYSNVITFKVVGNAAPPPYMQDLNSSNIGTWLPEVGSTTIAVDKRDGKEYAIGKLADGNVWLLDNLALDLTDPDVQDAMYDSTADPDAYSVNTHAKNSTLYKLFNGGGTTSDQYPTAKLNNVAWTSASQDYYSIPMIAVDSTTSGTCENAYCVNDPTSGNWSYDSTTQATINDITSVYQGKIGIYYNYCAASAGSYCYGNGTKYTGSPASDPDTSTLQDVKEDICPAGWRLPTGNTGGEFDNLYTQYGSNYTNFQTALHTPLSGCFRSGKVRNQGYFGYFWSSTWSNTNLMRRLYFNYNYVGPSIYEFRYYGLSIRCLLSS